LKQFGSIPLIAVLAMCAPLSFASENGKALYNNSCITCHGAAGEGNPVMDRFYKFRIPRLNADYVQGKSDDELKNVILNGKRRMPVAMNGLPETQHRSKIKPEQVPDLITYVRTLKTK
jgi:mono/diheme cytochrome c family protein